MAGHSKWSKVRRGKGAFDIKRGQLPRKLSHEIIVAARNATDRNGIAKTNFEVPDELPATMAA